MIVDADGTPLAVGDRVLHIEDELEWVVFAMYPAAGPDVMRVFLAAPTDSAKDRRQLMSSVDGTPFRKLPAHAP